MRDKLRARARQSLKNEVEVSDEIIDKAASDAEVACANKAVAYYIKEDFAYVRVKIYLKISLSDEDLMLYETALKAIKAAEFIDENGNLQAAKVYKVVNREDFL